MAEAAGGVGDWGQRGALQPRQAAQMSSQDATPLDSNAYPGSEAADADGDSQQYDDGDDDEEDEGDDDKDEDYQ